ncbi:glutathione-regulated potassium-efflux system protein KefB [Wenzhouxiangella sp. XN79A]|uniref:monovalent cation:proton antiporter-2 (CPA2) family protein n=1 Tax=Wenzhouxiangella sp. XN79A TaxID=2724193 RepID=UPI00144AA3C0|nr:monovalent cation:proton antiporter-2 (CPA2) family protein [Wenzhouxiangella sp. XN79A]NKI36252.1 glutathione-regulated potassium-efflux system protein KefB [Wenzhouxiangella sp. XN79A]
MGQLGEVVIFLASAVIMVPLARRFGLGAVLGYLAAGILIGPWGLGLITDVETKLHFAELGVVLMLFVIGLELRPSRLLVLRKLIFVNGSLQLALTTLALWPLAAWWLGDARLGFVIAIVLSLSSTAIGLQMLAEKKQLTTPYGRSAFGILLLQDIAVIPLLALIPLFALAPEGEEAGGYLLPALKAIAIVVGIVVGGRYLLRPFFRAVVKTGVYEIFLAAVLLVVLGTALLAEWAGLSMALGAFLAGVLLSDSEFRHELEAGIDPFKGLLLGLFFIAVGMTIDFGRVGSEPGLVFGMVGVLMGIKFAILLVVARIGGLRGREALSLAFALPQAGEFGFVLFKVAVYEGVLEQQTVDPLIVAITISMALTPLLYFVNERWVLPRLREPDDDKPQFEGIPDDHGEPRVIIAGLGRVGQIVARNLSMLGIHFTALDFDQVHVDFVRKFGHRVYYGNASNLDVLRSAGVAHAKLFVLTISDIELSLRTAEMVKRHFPDVRIHARARNRQHALELMALGVEFVIRESWLSSLELARESLRAVGVRNPSQYVDRFREHDEATLSEQVQHKDDEEQLVRIDRRSREQLADLFEDDREALRRGSGGDGG